MKAISLWQPWASAIALGAKRIETRHWATMHRGPLLIHAAKLRKRENFEFVENDFRHIFKPLFFEEVINCVPYGALVAVADLVDCVEVDLIPPRHFDGDRKIERAFGNYARGRFGWILENVRALPEPIPFKGRQGLFNVPDDLEGLVI